MKLFSRKKKSLSLEETNEWLQNKAKQSVKRQLEALQDFEEPEYKLCVDIVLGVLKCYEGEKER